MAVRPILIRRPPEAVWAVLADGGTYARWVVGARDSHPDVGEWPEVGSAIRYVVGLGPLKASGHTVVRSCEPGSHLELEARGGVLGTARIAIDLRPWGEATLVIVDEHPLTGPGGRLHNFATDAALQPRHRRMLRNLARVVEREGPRENAH